MIQSDKITDPVVLDHLQSAHRLALYLYSSSGPVDTARTVMRNSETLLLLCSTSTRSCRPISSNADGTVMVVLERLNRNDAPTAAERVQAGFGRLQVIK